MEASQPPLVGKTGAAGANKPQETAGAREDVGEGQVLCTAGGSRHGAAAWKTAVQFLKKLKTELASDLALSLLGVWPQEMKADFQEISAHPRSQQHHSP